MTNEKNYTKHITTEYDTKFKAVKELKWDPWVGKNYAKTGILIMGNSTYYGDDEDGKCWQEYCEKNRDPSRTLIPDFFWRKPFKPTSEMFIEGAGKTYSNEYATMFWESVAFNNHCQKAVHNSDGECEDIKQANCAFYKTLDILQPKLCLVWGVGLMDNMEIKGGSWSDTKINGTYPRVAESVGKRLPIIGIKHPSRGFRDSDWFEFLRDNSVSKKPVSDFINYLEKCEVPSTTFPA